VTSWRLTPRARRDLDEIWDYTAKRWDAAQADRYVRAIAAACANLAKGQRQDRDAGDIRPGYRRCTVGSHVLFYRRNDRGELEIVRILHQRMDVDRHL
jgi:toxin ParE1/3/4